MRIQYVKSVAVSVSFSVAPYCEFFRRAVKVAREAAEPARRVAVEREAEQKGDGEREERAGPPGRRADEGDSARKSDGPPPRHLVERLAHAFGARIGKGCDGEHHGHAAENGQHEERHEEHGRRGRRGSEVEDEGEVKKQAAAERDDAERARAAVLHDFEHALAAAAREQAVDGVHEAVAVQPARQEDRQQDEEGRRGIREAEERKDGAANQELDAAEHEADKREAAHGAAEVLDREVGLGDEADAGEELECGDKRTQIGCLLSNKSRPSRRAMSLN